MEEEIPMSSGEMGEAESGGASLSSIGTDAMKHRVAYFYKPSIGDYYYSQGHLMKPHRIHMAHNLIIHYPVSGDFSRLPKKPPDRHVATSTLTLNQMKVTKFWFGREPFKEGAYSNVHPSVIQLIKEGVTLNTTGGVHKLKSGVTLNTGYSMILDAEQKGLITPGKSTTQKTSLFTGFAQVSVTAYKNRKLPLPPKTSPEFYHHKKNSDLVVPTDRLRFLNKAYVIKDHEQDIASDGSAINYWSLFTVDQVEELKAIIKVIPLWSTRITMSINIGSSFGLLQAKSLDRHITSNFEIPVGFFSVILIVAVLIWIPVVDKATWNKQKFDYLQSTMPWHNALYPQRLSILKKCGITHRKLF